MDRIDVHAHGFPEDYLRLLARYYPSDVRLADGADGALVAIWSGAPLPAWDGPRRLREMDRDDVAIEVLSVPTVYSWLDARTEEMCQLLNDFQASVVATSPDRFRSFLHLPVHDPAASQREIARWAGRREVAGVLFGSNMGGRYPGEPALAPIWEAIHDAALPVFVHPVKPGSCFGPVVPPVVLFPCDTTIAAASIIYSGLFEKFAGIKIILSHYGGALPFIAARLDMAVDVAGFPKGHGQDLSAPPSTYVGRFYVDAAQGFHRPAFECARAVFGLDHILYGTDHFFVDSPWRARLNAFLAELGLPDEELARVLRKNAEALLPCL